MARGSGTVPDGPVRLLGTEPQLRAAARAAVRASVAGGGLPDDVVARLVELHRRRARLRHLSPELAAGGSSSHASGGRAPGRWWWLVGATAAGPALATLVLLLAPTPAPAVALAVAAAVLLLATGAAVDLLRDPAVPDARAVRRSTAESVAAAIVVGGVLGLVLGLALALTPDRGAPAWWLALLAVPLVLASVVALRLERTRRRSGRPTAADRAEQDAATAAWLARETEREAARLARLPRDADRRRAAEAVWRAELAALARYLPEDVLAQALSLSPAAWITWWAYDGRAELRVPLIVPLGPR